MIKKVPSDSELASYAEQMYLLFGSDDDLTLSDIIEAAFYVRDVQLGRLNPFVVFSLLHPAMGSQVLMRQDDQNGRLPRAHHIERLLDIFVVACRETLQLPVDDKTGVRLWQLGAFGRAIRPFLNSNTIIFLLVENRLRLDCGLGWNHRCYSKEVFELYFERVFKTNFGWAFAP